MKDVAFISCFFNPANFIKPVKNCISFMEHTVGKKFPANDFFFAQIECDGITHVDATKYIPKGNYFHIKSDSILWHKERLFNLLIDKFNLYDKYNYICWMDADILFASSIKGLDTKKIDAFQPFKVSIRQADKTGKESFTIDSWAENPKDSSDIGLSWGIKSSILKSVGGFFDYGILGGGDTVMAYRMSKREMKFGCEKLDEEVALYFKNDYIKRERVAALNNTVTHLFHGKIKNRQYNERVKILKKYKYNPLEDLTVEKNGLYRLINKEFEAEIKNYFLNRKEDE